MIEERMLELDSPGIISIALIVFSVRELLAISVGCK